MPCERVQFASNSRFHLSLRPRAEEDCPFGSRLSRADLEPRGDLGADSVLATPPAPIFNWYGKAQSTTMWVMDGVDLRWMRVLLVGLLVVAALIPVCAARSIGEEIAADAGQSVEILRGDQNDQEKEKKPARRGSCAWQCERFRKQCEVYCKGQGRLPGIRSRSRNCREDCKQYKMACSLGCRGNPSRSSAFISP